MTKDTVPEHFTLSLAAMDAVPVLLFGATMILLGRLAASPLFLCGAVLMLAAGAAKVLWKFIVVLKRKNVWWLFLQMRILMPFGFALALVGLIVGRASLDGGRIWAAATAMPSAIFFAAGVLGMALMMVFAFVLDSCDVRSNWIEQVTNAAAQASFFIGVLLSSV